MIGLEIDLKKIAAAGQSITLTAGVQIVAGAFIGVLFFLACGFGLGGGKWDALYLGIAAALSSTVIIVKVLYEKQELDTLTGRITLGVLVLQDLAAILFLAIQPNLGNLAFSVLMMSLVACGGIGARGDADQSVRAACDLPACGAVAGTGAGRGSGVVFSRGGIGGAVETCREKWEHWWREWRCRRFPTRSM
jgi:hypothetical protein